MSIDSLIVAGSGGPGPFVGNLAVLFAGWVLGILSSPITDAIRRRSVKQRMTRAIRTELQSLQDAFASVVIQVARRRGQLTHSLLEAMMAALASSGQSPGSARTLRVIDDLLNAEEGTRPPASAMGSAGSRTFLSLKVQGVPFLESHLHRLDFYTHETQRRLLEIHAGSQVFNQYADEAMHYHLMSFGDDVDHEHMASLQANIEKCYERAAEKAGELVSQVASLLQSPEMKTR